MKKIVAVALVVIALAVTLAPAPAEAGRRFWTGFAVGTATGLVFSPLLAPRYYYVPAPVYYAPPPVYYAPAPVYFAPPPPVCSQTFVPGYWANMPVYNGYGYTTYQYQYVPDRYQTVCR